MFIMKSKLNHSEATFKSTLHIVMAEYIPDEVLDVIRWIITWYIWHLPWIKEINLKSHIVKLTKVNVILNSSIKNYSS